MYRVRCYYSNLFDDGKGRFLLSITKLAIVLVPKGDGCIDLFFSLYSDALIASRAINSDYPFVTQTEIVQDKVYAE